MPNPICEHAPIDILIGTYNIFPFILHLFWCQDLVVLLTTPPLFLLAKAGQSVIKYTTHSFLHNYWNR